VTKPNIVVNNLLTVVHDQLEENFNSISLNNTAFYCLSVHYSLIGLLYIVLTHNVTISPSGAIQGAIVGNPQVINCTVSTVNEVEFSSLVISWLGSVNITNDDRVIISPTTSSGNTYTSRLYLLFSFYLSPIFRLYNPHIVPREIFSKS